MVSAIFSTEISSLESQVAQLQATIAQLHSQTVQLQSTKTALNEAELKASGTLQTIKDTVREISGLTPSARASFKAAVDALFNSGDGGHGGDDKPEPTPEPPQPNLKGQSTELCCQWEDCPAESLLGQSVKIACLLEYPQEPTTNNKVGESSEVAEKT